MNDDFQRRLAAAFPPETDQGLIRAINEGILLADGLVDAEPFLSNLIGRDLRGHLRRAGILFRLNGACAEGLLPFQAVIGKMPRGHLHWLEISSGEFDAHLCRTEGPFSFPEDTLTRQDERLRNQLDLFEPNYMPPRESAASDRLAAWLMFGGNTSGQLQHLCWAMPEATGDHWLAHVNVLRRAAANSDLPETNAQASKSLTLKFKEHIELDLARRGIVSDKNSV